jgi:Cu2+-containing amine oxidase
MAPFGDFHQLTGAGWSVWWRIREFDGSGLEVWWADFHGRRVLWRGSQPFAIVPYHHPIPGEPVPPEFTFKDGMNPQCHGASFRALRHGAPNSSAPWTSNAWDAAVDTDAVVVEVDPATDFEPAVMTVVAKFQCGWYQYVHRWEFRGDGEIRPHLGMGGALNPNDTSKSHVHHMYFRVDLDIDGFSSDVFEVFRHSSFNDPGGDAWSLVATQGKHLFELSSARKFRVRDLKSKSDLGALRGYEIEVPQSAPPDTHGTGDVWVTVYRGDNVEQGAEVGSSCDDRELEQLYAKGPLDTVNGSDIVLWIAIRHHHEPRFDGEEAEFLPYHYEEFSIVPRGFEVFHVQRR